MIRTAAISAALFAACTPVPGEFRCTTDLQCARGAVAGRCEPEGWCSVADASCLGSGRRFVAAGASADRCVVVLPALLDHLPADAGWFSNEELTLSQPIDTDSPPLGPWDVWAQDDGVEVLVLHAASVTVPSTAVVRVSGSRPLVVLARDAIEVAGVLDVSARGVVPGPGGGDSRREGPLDGLAGVGELQRHWVSGGGGGGHGTVGAEGGTAGDLDQLLGGHGGRSSTAPIERLVGGGAGGLGGTDTCVAARGGGGGGALFLFAKQRIVVARSGRVLAGGGGGEGGRTCLWSGAGAGGGAGGTLLFRAESVEISGTLAANGGGGGSGAGLPGPQPFGSAGEDGRAALSQALGGSRPQLGSATSGGAGGSAQGAPQTPPRGGLNDAGGGGGAVGRIVITSTQRAVEGVLSPAPQLRTP